MDSTLHLHNQQQTSKMTKSHHEKAPITTDK